SRGAGGGGRGLGGVCARSCRPAAQAGAVGGDHPRGRRRSVGCRRRRTDGPGTCSRTGRGHHRCGGRFRGGDGLPAHPGGFPRRRRGVGCCRGKLCRLPPRRTGLLPALGGPARPLTGRTGTHETGTTVPLVTHSLVQAVYLGTRVMVMSARPGTVLEELEVPIA